MENERIHTIEEFRERLREEDRIWTIYTHSGVPKGVEGPLTIARFLHGRWGPMVDLRTPTSDSETPSYIDDLLDESRGVFLTQEAAEAGLAAVQKRFDEDPNREEEAFRRWLKRAKKYQNDEWPVDPSRSQVYEEA